MNKPEETWRNDYNYHRLSRNISKCLGGYELKTGRPMGCCHQVSAASTSVIVSTVKRNFHLSSSSSCRWGWRNFGLEIGNKETGGLLAACCLMLANVKWDKRDEIIRQLGLVAISVQWPVENHKKIWIFINDPQISVDKSIILGRRVSKNHAPIWVRCAGCPEGTGPGPGSSSTSAVCLGFFVNLYKKDRDYLIIRRAWEDLVFSCWNKVHETWKLQVCSWNKSQWAFRFFDKQLVRKSSQSQEAFRVERSAFWAAVSGLKTSKCRCVFMSRQILRKMKMRIFQNGWFLLEIYTYELDISW